MMSQGKVRHTGCGILLSRRACEALLLGWNASSDCFQDRMCYPALCERRSAGFQHGVKVLQTPRAPFRKDIGHRSKLFRATKEHHLHAIMHHQASSPRHATACIGCSLASRGFPGKKTDSAEPWAKDTVVAVDRVAKTCRIVAGERWFLDPQCRQRERRRSVRQLT